MSKIGKKSIQVPAGVTFEVVGNLVKFTGPKGTDEYTIPQGANLDLKDGELSVMIGPKVSSAMHGTTRANIANIVKGLSEGWSKSLEIVGTGYRAETSGNDLVLTVGYSHPVKYTAPAGITFKVEKMIITVTGTNRQLVGQVASEIREIRKPEPYKGKGIKYTTEVVRRKVGKAAKAAGAAA